MVLSTTLAKRRRVLALIVILSLSLTAATTFAATELIRARSGGTIQIAPGVRIVIPPKALAEDTLISAVMEYREEGEGEELICFEFEPDGTTLAKPARLIEDRRIIDDLDELTLYGENGEEIKPIIRGKWIVYEINHFSLYYHRRR